MTYDFMIARKRIGLLGGISHESTARYYTTLHRKYFERCGNHQFPEVVVYSLNFQQFTDLENGPDPAAYINYIRTGIDGLLRAGVEGIAMTANSPHAVYDHLVDECPVPVLNLIEAVCAYAAERNLRTLLLLGIKFTMQSDFYQRTGDRHGLSISTPCATAQDRIEQIIFSELSHGDIRATSRAAIQSMVGDHPCDGVILGCTELPLLIGPNDLTVPSLDTIDIHTERILDWALSPDA